MNIDKELIKRVAELSRLRLQGNEIDKFAKEFQEIINAFSKIKEVNTDDAKPSFQPVEIKNIYREDVVKKGLSQEEALANAEHKKDGYFKGPKAV
jgi:aspartyl-tRNA(Asn)/glutamyl-tRNA(Gln) amidotransferase subunit C